MGNEPSSQARDEVLPQMVLYLETLMLWSGRTVAQSPARDYPEKPVVESKSSSSSCTVEGETLFAQVLIDGREVEDGRIDRFPSQPIVIKPSHLDSELQIKFYLGTPPANWSVAPTDGTILSARLVPWSIVSAPMSNLYMFGAPLFTSTWLGLTKMEPHFGHDTSTSFFEALQRAHLPDPDVPKVKVTVFKPSPLDMIAKANTKDPRSWQPKHDVLLPFGSETGFDCVEHGDATIKANAVQLEGLIKCVEQSNLIVKRLQEATKGFHASRNSVSDDRNAINRLDREIHAIKYSINEIEEQWSAQGLEDEYTKLRREISDVNERHYEEVKLTADCHMSALRAEDTEIQRIKDVAQQRASDLSKEYDLKMNQYHKSMENAVLKVDQEISSARWRWERSAAGELAEATENGKKNLAQVQSDGAARLVAQRKECEDEAKMLRGEIRDLLASLSERVQNKEVNEAECDKASKELSAVRSLQDSESEAARKCIQREIEMLQKETSKAEAARFTEIEKLREELLNMQQRRIELLEEAEKQRSEDIASISNANKRELQEEVKVADSKIEDLSLEHERALEQERETWQSKCFIHEKQLMELRVNADLQSEQKSDKLERLESLEQEASVLAGEVSELRHEHAEQTAKIERATGSFTTRVRVAQDEAARKMLQLENAISNLRCAEADEWDRLNSERALELSQRQEEESSLRKELELRREEALKHCSELQKAWEEKCEQSSQAASTAQTSCKYAEDAAAKALIERRLEIHERLESAQATRQTELEALESEFSSLSKSTQDESARLSQKLNNLRRNLSIRLAEIAEEGNRNLESRRQLLTLEHTSKLSDLKLELDRAHSEKDSVVAAQLRDHELSLVPVQAELEALRVTSALLPDAMRENRSLKHDLANERALLDLASSAHSDAEAMLASRSTAIQKIQTEMSAMEAELSKAQERLEGEKMDLEKASTAYNTSLIHIQRERERADAAKERNISRLKQSLAVHQSNFEATRAARMSDVEAKCLEEKTCLEERFAALQLELEESKLAGERALKQLQEKFEGELEVELSCKEKIAQEMQQAQQGLDELRLEVEEAERVEQREHSASVAALQEKGRKELTKLVNTSNAEIQSMALVQQNAFGKLQAAHESERQRFQELFAGQEARLDALRQHHTKAEEDVEKMSDAVALLQKDINSTHDQHARDMQNVTAAQEATLANTRKVSADRTSRMQSAGEAQEQALMQQLRAVELDVQLARDSSNSLRLEGERQKVKADRAVERSTLELKRLKEKLKSTVDTIEAERARNADKQERQEQETIASKESYESKKMSYQVDQERLERKLETLQQEVAVLQERLKSALADMEGQEKQFALQLQLEIDEQERGFQQQRKTQETQYQNECEAQDAEQIRARSAQRSKQQEDLDQLQTEMAELSTQVESMKEAPAKIELSKQELMQLEEQCASLQNCIKASALLQVERREAELGRLEALHASELEETHSQFTTLLSKSRRDADEVRRQLEDEMREKRDKFNKKAAELRASMEELRANQAKSQASFEIQLSKDIKEMQLEQSARNERLREEVQAARIECDLQTAAKSGREAEFRECLTEQLQAARSAADEKVKAAHDREKEAAEADYAGTRTIMAEKTKMAKEASEVLKDMLDKSMQDFNARLERELASETERGQAEKSKCAVKQRESEERLTMAQVQLAAMQGNIDEKTRFHELALQEKANSEQRALEKAKKQFRYEQAGSVSELSEAQKSSQEALRRMQDECFGTIDKVRQQAAVQSEKRIRDATAKFRNDLWTAQQNYNVWQKRLEKLLREFEQVGCVDGLFEKPLIHPCEFLYNRLLLRMFRALLEEKHSVWNESELSGLFDTLPKADEGGRSAELSKEAFRQAVHQSLCFHRKFDLGKFIRTLEQSYTGTITAEDFENRLQANLALDKATIAQIYKFADAAANVAASSGGTKPQPGILQEDDLAALLDHPQVRKAFESETSIDDLTRSSRPPLSRLSSNDGKPFGSVGRIFDRMSSMSSNDSSDSRSRLSRSRADEIIEAGEDKISQRIGKALQSSNRSLQRLGRGNSEPKLPPAPSPATFNLLGGEVKEKDQVFADLSASACYDSTSSLPAHYDGESRWV